MHDPDFTPPPPGNSTLYNDRYRIGEDTLTHSVLHAWWFMAESTRKLIARKPSEAYLLMLLLASDMAFFLSWMLKIMVVPNATRLELFSVEMGLLLSLSLFVRTGVMYVFAMCVGAVCRICGGHGTWRNTRIAVFWGAFVTAPFGVLAAIITVIISNLGAYFPIFNASWILLPPYWIGMLPFVWYISAGVAKAQGFNRTAPLFFSMSLVSLVGLILAMYFRVSGII